MAHLPVIVGFGGVNAAGRSSFHHGYRRLVFDALATDKQQQTLASLAQMMAVADDAADREQQLLLGTLIRQLDPGVLDANAVDYNHMLKLGNGDAQTATFLLKARYLPAQIPAHWSLETCDTDSVRVTVSGAQNLLVPSQRALKAQAAGQLPSGFDPGKLYASRNHPRGLQMTVYGASDALGSMGIDWETVLAQVSPDQISVYAGSGMSQLDANGNGGMMSARFNGKRVTSKQCPLGFAEMPADFINAYLLGSLGTTGTSMGACASFLYNLRSGIMDIQSGQSRVVVVGNSEAPIVPDIIEGYGAMGALATDKELTELDGGTLNYRRACRPFGENRGFTLAESAQFIVLFDDSLAVDLGAQIHGAVTDVFVNADGFKKSISAPGAGNYLTVARALASAKALVGDKAVQQRSFVQAHGTGTPQNRVTESDVLNTVAKQFGIDSWPVVAVKNYLGHSIGVAGADQLVASLGVWEEGILPGITSIDKPAEDVHRSNLQISNKHQDVGVSAMDVAVINAKGFGGNNASATLLSPSITQKIVSNKHKGKAWKKYSGAVEQTRLQAQQYDTSVIAGQSSPSYHYDCGVIGGEELDFSSDAVKTPRYGKAVSLKPESPYAQWLD